MPMSPERLKTEIDIRKNDQKTGQSVKSLVMTIIGMIIVTIIIVIVSWVVLKQ
jgi:hypothetical protein